MGLNKKKKDRFLFLQKLYDETHGDTSYMNSMWDLGIKLNIPQEEVSRIVDYLIGEGLIEARAMGGLIGLTHFGIKEIEKALENPDRATEHFLPINIINIGTMTNSTLQQATTNSTVTVYFENEKINDLESVLESLKGIQDVLKISVELHKELVSEIQTLEIQKQSPKPKSIIITESLKTIRSLLENIVGNTLTPVIVEQITQILK